VNPDHKVLQDHRAQQDQRENPDHKAKLDHKANPGRKDRPALKVLQDRLGLLALLFRLKVRCWWDLRAKLGRRVLRVNLDRKDLQDRPGHRVNLDRKDLQDRRDPKGQPVQPEQMVELMMVQTLPSATKAAARDS
jgi:hypothetical protein